MNRLIQFVGLLCVAAAAAAQVSLPGLPQAPLLRTERETVEADPDGQPILRQPDPAGEYDYDHLYLGSGAQAEEAALPAAERPAICHPFPRPRASA